MNKDQFAYLNQENESLRQQVSELSALVKAKDEALEFAKRTIGEFMYPVINLPKNSETAPLLASLERQVKSIEAVIDLTGPVALDKVKAEAIKMLHRWTHHDRACEYLHTIPEGKIAKPCSCGLDTTLARLKGE